MSTTNKSEVETTTVQGDNAATEQGQNTQTENEVTETETSTEEVTYTQAELDKKVQSATDALRAKYSAKIKKLENQVKELTPVEKSEAELDFERRLANLEAREKAIALSDNLKSKGISNDLAQFLKDDADIDALSTVLEGLYKNKLKSNSYIPESHKSGDSLTKEEFRKMSYADRAQLFDENPELFRQLSSRR